MARRLSYSAMMLAWSVAPAFAGDSGSQDSVGALIVQTMTHLVGKVVGLF
jgi:hypothetical protein